MCILTSDEVGPGGEYIAEDACVNLEYAKAESILREFILRSAQAGQVKRAYDVLDMYVLFALLSF